MTIIIDLTDDTAELLKANGHIINGRDGNTYVNLPQWFKTTETPNRMEVLYTDQLPEEVQLFIREVSIKQALEAIVLLHLQEKKAFAKGLTPPTPEEWNDAIADAETALNYDI